jgi:hypothetical protein
MLTFRLSPFCQQKCQEKLPTANAGQRVEIVWENYFSPNKQSI